VVGVLALGPAAADAVPVAALLLMKKCVHQKRKGASLLLTMYATQSAKKAHPSHSIILSVRSRCSCLLIILRPTATVALYVPISELVEPSTDVEACNVPSAEEERAISADIMARVRCSDAVNALDFVAALSPWILRSKQPAADSPAHQLPSRALVRSAVQSLPLAAKPFTDCLCLLCAAAGSVAAMSSLRSASAARSRPARACSTEVRR